MKKMVKCLAVLSFAVLIGAFCNVSAYARPLDSVVDSVTGKSFPVLSDVFIWIEKDMGLDPDTIQIKYLYGNQVPVRDRDCGGWINKSEPNTVYVNATGIHDSFANSPKSEYLAYVLFVSHELQHIKQIRMGTMNWDNYTRNYDPNSTSYCSMNTEDDADKVSNYYTGRIVQIINGLEKMPEI